ncbi:hypothetical protein NPIL_601831 [Nephila pilipes]|uniref:Pre-C2HC domain-containing protein n=1 Tax=Nephila pilipes TaxID=299642 RepID=A0A8X6NSQ3_NEPPI|nr:hypothetical protein NPIL_601831 [Nephila pilipes]
MQTSSQNVSDNNCSSNSYSQQNGIPSPLPTTSNFTKKVEVPPITIDNPVDRAALLKELQQITGIKLTARLTRNSLKLFPPTPETYHQINRFINPRDFPPLPAQASHTCSLPSAPASSSTYLSSPPKENTSSVADTLYKVSHTSYQKKKMLRVVIRGMPADMPPTEIIKELQNFNIHAQECYNMKNRKIGSPMTFFLLNLPKTDNDKEIYNLEICYMKIKIEPLRKKLI